jgi:hypothetical protein
VTESDEKEVRQIAMLLNEALHGHKVRMSIVTRAALMLAGFGAARSRNFTREEYLAFATECYDRALLDPAEKE